MAPDNAPRRVARLRPPALQPNSLEPRLVLYSRSYCHLCDEMLAALRSQLGVDFPVTIVDVDGDPALEARYGEHVPVLVEGDTEICRYRYDAAKLAVYLSEIR